MIGETEILAAIEAARARWRAAPVLDVRDVEERVALRLQDQASVETTVQECPPACRIFVRHARGWCSRYVHRLTDVDSTLDWIFGRCA